MNEIQLANWSGRVVACRTGETIQVPDDREWVVNGACVRPTKQYLPPSSSDRWAAPRDPDGDVVLTIDGIVDLDGIAVTQYHANAISLTDRYYRLHLAMDPSPVKSSNLWSGVAVSVSESARVIEWLADATANGPTADVEILTAALRTARIAWVSYRSAVLGDDLVLKIVVKPGRVLRIERRVSGVLGGPGEIIEDPLEVELSIFEKTELPPIKLKRGIQLDDPRIGMLRDAFKSIETELVRSDITAEQKIERLAEMVKSAAEYVGRCDFNVLGE
ncbi:hypothetical protein LCGC14_1655470 [marine sediment metagenome]|uniref:Uncharacterized protein n=1 Tax=marine sediment metagenome TaxID=412755 RepID=A0A0F9KVT0_9ZZZZ